MLYRSMTCCFLYGCLYPTGIQASYHPKWTTLLHNRNKQRSGRSVHERFHQKLSYHALFPTLPTTWTTQEDDTDQEVVQTVAGASHLTLEQAKVAHQLALETTNEVRRAHAFDASPSSCRSNHHVEENRWRTGRIHRESDENRSTRSSNSNPNNNETLPLFLPIDYGADPLGERDSTDAFQRLVTDFLRTDSQHIRPMADGIVNLGGATIDLQGGHYLISQPIVIPPMFGNAHIMDGTLEASTRFPPDGWLIEIGDYEQCQPKRPDGADDPQLVCNHFIDVTSVLLDANFQAAGGIRMSRVMGTILTNVFVTGFVKVGLLISGGHGVMISEAWLAECYWSSNKRCTEQHSQSVGIRIDGMDHYVTNTIVFDFAKVGVEITKPATLLEGVHTWNGGGHGIVVGSSSHTAGVVRLIGCYLDYETLDIWDPLNVVVESTFFYHGHAVLYAGASKSVHGLTMRFNRYNMNQSVVLHGTFDSISAVSIQEEVDWAKTTRSSKSLTQRDATEWKFDFGKDLLFPSVDFVTYTLASSAGFVSHMALPPNGTSVSIVTSVPTNATVYITAEQGV